MDKKLTEELIEDSKEYIYIISDIITKLEKAKPKDRLDYAVEITNCLNGLMLSIHSWKSWLTNLKVLKSLTIEELKQIYPAMLETTIKFLNMDLEISKKKMVEVAVKHVSRKKKKRVVEDVYIS